MWIASRVLEGLLKRKLQSVHYMRHIKAYNRNPFIIYSISSQHFSSRGSILEPLGCWFGGPGSSKLMPRGLSILISNDFGIDFCSVLCPLWFVFCAVWSLLCSLCCALFDLCCVLCGVCYVFCALCCVLFCAAHSMQCAVCSML